MNSVTISVPSLGPSWLPKLGGLIGLLAAAFSAVPDDAPGVKYIKPWIPFMNALAIGLVGFTSRQNNVPSEAIGVAPGQPGAKVPPPEPPKP